MTTRSAGTPTSTSASRAKPSSSVTSHPPPSGSMESPGSPSRQGRPTKVADALAVPADGGPDRGCPPAEGIYRPSRGTGVGRRSRPRPREAPCSLPGSRPDPSRATLPRSRPRPPRLAPPGPVGGRRCRTRRPGRRLGPTRSFGPDRTRGGRRSGARRPGRRLGHPRSFGPGRTRGGRRSGARPPGRLRRDTRSRARTGPGRRRRDARARRGRHSGRGLRRGGRFREHLHRVQPCRIAPGPGLRLLVGVELLHGEHEVLAAVRRNFRLPGHHDGVGGTDLDAQLAVDAGIEVEHEVVGVAALLPADRRLALATELDGDDLGGTDALALQASDACLVPVLLVEQGEARPVALGARADDVGELHRGRTAEEVGEADGQRPDRRRQVVLHGNTTTQVAAAPTRSTPIGTSHFQHSPIS